MSRVIDLGFGGYIEMESITAILATDVVPQHAVTGYALHGSGGDFSVVCHFRGSLDGVVLGNGFTAEVAAALAAELRTEVMFGEGSHALDHARTPASERGLQA